MRLPSIGWAFFGLVALAGAIYLLNRGVYVGSSIRMRHEELDDGYGKKVSTPYYNKYCHYLLLNDIRQDWSTGSFKEYEAENGFCSPLRNSN